jgi:hypothetical protein
MADFALHSVRVPMAGETKRFLDKQNSLAPAALIFTHKSAEHKGTAGEIV